VARLAHHRPGLHGGDWEGVMTREQAIALYESKFWETLSFQERAEFQLHTDLLCMPFDVFHEAIEKSLGRSVWTHEFADRLALVAEFYGDKKPPTFETIMEMIPEEKRLIIARVL
jgi:hypothetical protein